jgi:predicted enzyme related to lactoylglutathione lyase
MSHTVIFYVADTAVSAAFYAELLGRSPFEQGSTFVAFMLDGGLTLGLWRKDEVMPLSENPAGACELGFKVGHDQISTMHADWRDKGAAIILPPTELGFGTSFVALDPDGHRLRVYAMAGDMPQD